MLPSAQVPAASRQVRAIGDELAQQLPAQVRIGASLDVAGLQASRNQCQVGQRVKHRMPRRLVREAIVVPGATAFVARRDQLVLATIGREAEREWALTSAGLDDQFEDAGGLERGASRRPS